MSKDHKRAVPNAHDRISTSYTGRAAVSKPKLLELGKGLRYYTVGWYAENLGLTVPQTRALVAALGIPVVYLGEEVWILHTSFVIAMFAIGMIGKKNFLGPGSGRVRNDGRSNSRTVKHWHKKGRLDRVTVESEEILGDMPFIVSCLLYGTRTNGLEIDQKSVEHIRKSFDQLRTIVSSTQRAYEKAALAWAKKEGVVPGISEEILQEVEDAGERTDEERTIPDPESYQDLGGGSSGSRDYELLQPDGYRKRIRERWLQYRRVCRDEDSGRPRERAGGGLEDGSAGGPGPENADPGRGEGERVLRPYGGYAYRKKRGRPRKRQDHEEHQSTDGEVPSGEPGKTE